MRKMGKIGTVTGLLALTAMIGGVTYQAIVGPKRTVTEGVKDQTSADLVIKDRVSWDFYDHNGTIDLAYRTTRNPESGSTSRTEFKGEDAQRVKRDLEARCTKYKQNKGPEVCF
jgi:hypothetical protein